MWGVSGTSRGPSSLRQRILTATEHPRAAVFAKRFIKKLALIMKPLRQIHPDRQVCPRIGMTACYGLFEQLASGVPMTGDQEAET